MGSPRVGVCGAHRVLYGQWRELLPGTHGTGGPLRVRAAQPIRCASTVNDRWRQTMTARSDAGRRVVIFVHIGKTAGTTLGAIATRQYPSKSIFQVDSGAQMTPAEQVRALPPATKRNLSLIMGHLQFGVHSDLPLPSTYTTLLRDPVERTVSSYLHVVRSPRHRLHSQVVGAGMDLLQYATSGISEELDNWQTRCVAGPPAPAIGDCTEQLLERALRNIDEHFTIVGICERFDETLVLLKRLLGWRRIYYAPLNTADGTVHERSATDEEREGILQWNRWDQALYEHASVQFTHRLGGLGDISPDLRALSSANSVYRPVYRTMVSWQTRVRSALRAPNTV